MRWLTIPPDDTAGLREKEARIAAIDRFWAEVGPGLDRLKSPGEEDIAWFQNALHAVDPRIMFEISGDPGSSVMELALTPEAEHYLRPMVSTLLDRAPSVSGWKFVGYRSPVAPSMLEHAMQARLGHSIHAKGVDIRVERSAVNLTYHFGGFGKASNPMYEEALILTELLLGEEELDVRVGAIDAKASVMPKPQVPIHQLKQVFEQKKQELGFQAPPEPRYKTPYHQRPLGQVDLRHAAEGNTGLDVGFDDALVVTADPKFLEYRFTFKLFHSENISRFGEVFFYLQFERPASWSGNEADARGNLEEHIDRNIAPNGLGAVVGGIHGLNYSSIHIAASQLWPCVDAVRVVVGSVGLGRRAWILFHDSTMASEWIGIYPDTPEPRGLEE